MDRVFEAANLPLGPRINSFGSPAVEAVVQLAPEIETPSGTFEATAKPIYETPQTVIE